MMKKEINTGRIPIKLWLDDMEEGAMEQARNLAELPFAFSHIAIMPDSHQGFGMPIGGVLATEDVIIPNAVGVDIGCGMCSLKTSWQDVDKKTLIKIVESIKRKVPVGFKHHNAKQDASLMPDRSLIDKFESISSEEYNNALTQIGTLGGGNHFIELQNGDDGHIYIMIHSGSRNIGKKVADHYNRLAKSLKNDYNSEIPNNWQLDYLKLDDEVGENYVTEMNFCVEFAFANRKLMMERVKEAFIESGKYVEFGDLVNIAHNYAAKETHFGEEVYVHRKGATSAKSGEIGIIPGSQGTKSYIVKGKGNSESFTSCSHGAGRKMGRKFAQKNLDLNKEIGRLDNAGIIHSINSIKDLDEAPSAYKNIKDVMKNQEDLVDILIELSPLAVVKG